MKQVYRPTVDLPGRNGHQNEHGSPLHVRDSRLCRPCASLCPIRRCAVRRQGKWRTERGPLQSLVGQPDLEPAVLFEEIKMSNSQTDTVDGDGVADVAVIEDRACEADGELAAAVVDDQGGDDAFVFDKSSEHSQPVHVTMHSLLQSWLGMFFLFFFFLLLNVLSSVASKDTSLHLSRSLPRRRSRHRRLRPS